MHQQKKVEMLVNTFSIPTPVFPRMLCNAAIEKTTLLLLFPVQHSELRALSCALGIQPKAIYKAPSAPAFNTTCVLSSEMVFDLRAS